jgi:hypothetical protein
VSFYPDGETRIPEQTPVPGASPSGPPAPREDPARRRTRVILRTAVINTAILVVAVLIGYVFPISDDPDVGLWIVVGASLLCAVNMSTVLMADQRRQRTEARALPIPPGRPSVADVGAPVTVVDAQPYGTVSSGFALTVEDVFSITGRGTVVTGQVSSGEVRVGQRVTIVREGQDVGASEVTGIEAFRSTRDVATAGDTIGLLLQGVSRSDVHRGDLLR